MTRQEKQSFLWAQFHMAWGHCKASPEYDKACWRVLAAVMERLCPSDQPHGSILDEIAFGDEVLGLQGGNRRLGSLEPQRRPVADWHDDEPSRPAGKLISATPVRPPAQPVRDLQIERAERLLNRLSQILDEWKQGM